MAHDGIVKTCKQTPNPNPDYRPPMGRMEERENPKMHYFILFLTANICGDTRRFKRSFTRAYYDEKTEAFKQARACAKATAKKYAEKYRFGWGKLRLMNVRVEAFYVSEPEFIGAFCGDPVNKFSEVGT